MEARSDLGPSILVVDDCPEARMLMAQELESAGFHVVQAGDGEAAWHTWNQTRPDLIVSDVRMPDGDGVELLRRVRTLSSVPVILVTAFADVPTAIAAIRAGAAEFLSFPDEMDRLVPRARALLAGGPAEDAIEQRLVGEALHEARERMRGLLDLDVTVLVSGESGTGRDCVIETLHELGYAASSPLRRVRADDAELQAPAGASIHLDGVEQFSPRAQRLWADRIAVCERGGTATRVYASCAAPLELLASQGRFDVELARRLTRFAIRLPPLRDRIGDLEQLVPALARRRGRELGRDGIQVGAAAIARLCAQPWPGNVRELDGVVTRLVAFSAGGSITASHVEMVLGERADAVVSLRSQREAQQREQLRELLTECGGNFAEVGRRLDLTRGAVVYRAKRFGLFHGRKFDG